jgi:predicted Rossmann fold flavoprotein
MAAIAAGACGVAPLLVLERSRDGGRKILISGGGRCNVLPSRLDPRDYVTDSSPNTLKKLLRAWPLPEQRAFFEDELGIRLKLEEETGKLFPVSDRARDVRDRLVDRAKGVGAQFRFNTSVVGLTPPEHPNRSWTVHLDGAPPLEARSVILAAGGLSVPATGSDGTGLRILEQMGHTVHPTYPALTPLLANPPVHAELAGVSLEVTLTAQSPTGALQTRGGFLFTHRGYSGPTVLNVSHLAVRARMVSRPQPILARWTHESVEEWDSRLQDGSSGALGSTLRRRLPTRLADRLLHEAGLDATTSMARLRKEDRRRLSRLLGAYELPWTGDEGYKKAEVTGGGVALGEIHPRTMESRLHPGLFLCGEILDAFGPIGGYNFAWAWATGRAAGQGVARASE